MGKLKKAAKKILSIIAIVILVLIFLFVMFGENAIKAGIETAGTKALNVGVSLEDLDLSLLKGQIEMKQLKVKNPAGYNIPYLLEMGKGYVDVKTTSLLSDQVVIDTILLDNLSLSLEQKGLSSNISTIIKSLPKSEKKAEDKAEEDTGKAEKKEGKKFVINELKITNVIVKVKLVPIGNKEDSMDIKLDTITLKDIGKESDVDIAKLTEVIILTIFQKITEAGAGVIPEDLMNSLDALKNIDTEKILDSSLDILKTGKEGGSEVTEKLKDAGEGAKDAAKDALEGIGGLFKKKSDE